MDMIDKIRNSILHDTDVDLSTYTAPDYIRTTPLKIPTHMEDGKVVREEFLYGSTAQMIQMIYGVTYDINANLFRYYKDGVYIPLPTDTDIYRLVEKPFEVDMLSQSEVTKIFKKLRHRSPSHDTKMIKQYEINWRNGILDINTGILRPHSRDDMYTVQYDIDYYYTYTRPYYFLKFLKLIFRKNPKMIGIVLESIALALLQKRPKLGKFFIYEGPTDSGKTTLADFIPRMFIPSRYIAQYELTPSGNPHENEDLEKATISLNTEVSENEKISQIRNVKKLSRQEGIKINPKGRKAYTPDNMDILMIFCCNNRPLWPKDSGNALANRLRLILTLESIPRDSPDYIPNIEAKLEGEKYKIFNFLLPIMRRLIQQKRLYTNMIEEEVRFSCKKWAEEYDKKREAQEGSIAGFVIQCVRAEFGVTTRPDIMYAAYKLYCNTKRYNIIPKEKFEAELSSKHDISQETVYVDEERIRIYKNYKVI